MMANTEERLKKLENVLKQYDAPMLQYLEPGLKKEDIITVFNQNKILLRPEIISLYEWHNGIDFEKIRVTHERANLMPLGIFYTLDFAIRLRESFIDWGYMENSTEYFPLFGSGEDDMYLISTVSGKIYFLSPAVQTFGDLEFSSLDAMLDCLIESYEEGILKIDLELGLVIMYEEFENKKGKYRY